MKISKNKIVILMTERNMKQKDLADAARINRGNLSTILNRGSCQMVTVSRIAKALNVEMKALLEDA